MWPSGEVAKERVNERELELRVAIRRSNKSNNRGFTEHGIINNENKWSSVRPSGGATVTTMMKEKERQAKRTMKHNANRASVGLDELRGYYFTHGDHGSGSKFNKTVEKIAEYCRVEVSKEIYQLILYGEIGRASCRER